MIMRRAKIVCTLGPATESADQIQALVDAGMDVARINRSHGSAAEHEAVFHHVREAAQASGRAVAVLVDLQGPKIRLGRFVEGEVELSEGQTFTITTEDVPGTAEIASTTYAGLPGDCVPGDRILIDDGRVAVRIIEVDGPRVVTRVEVPGPVSNNKGLNLPGVAVSVPALSEKDKEDLRWAVRLGADIIALSFVRNAADIDDVHAIMDEEGRRVPVIAKIEKPQAVENLVEIVDAFDGIMVARGDLGVELPLEEVPIVQKRAVELARRNAKPVIVATQVLDSMMSSPRPTRAEVSDCANAILDGTDAVMLSAETAVGDYPLEAVKMMDRIARAVEVDAGYQLHIRSFHLETDQSTADVVSLGACEMAYNVRADLIVTFTSSGNTALRVSRNRPVAPILAITPSERAYRQMAVVWGVVPHVSNEIHTTDEMVTVARDTIAELGMGVTDGRFVVTAGVPFGQSGTTNLIRIERMK